MKRIVLAYSGGLDTSVAIPWLAEHFDAEVVTVTLDLGQGREVDDVRERALAIGATRAHVIDVREEFAARFILPALQAGALYEGRSPLATALGQPLITKYLVDIARIEGAPAIAHGCTGRGNGQIRIEIAARALDPALEVIAPARIWGLSRAEEIEYAHARGIPVPAAVTGPYSVDVNLWGRSIEGGVLGDPSREPPEEVFALTKSPAAAPNAPAYVDLEFEQGVPVAINGVPLSLVELFASLEAIAGGHGVGRVDLLENRLVGGKSREVYEAPAALVLHVASRELGKLVTPRELDRLAAELSATYADLVYNGQWYSPAREAIDAFVTKAQERATGSVRIKLFKGSAEVVSRRSPFAITNIRQTPAATDTVRS
jgi:argininosuccinate synthase